MYTHSIPDNPYVLLTPGPLSTSKAVRAAMLRDWCTWDDDYNLEVVQAIRRRLTALGGDHKDAYTAVLMQGSGTFGVEACLGTAVPPSGKVLVVTNGAYGDRMAAILAVMGRAHTCLRCPETRQPDPEDIRRHLAREGDITHVALVHCETTTGILNPLAGLAGAAKEAGKVLIVDAMSSFGAIPLSLPQLDIDYLISSSNKCIQGVPGFSFVLAKQALLAGCAGNAHSHTLDLYDQWRAMDGGGKWRFTSPTHVVRALLQALDGLEAEGGVEARHRRYRENQRVLVEGMGEAGFTPLLPQELQSPVITSFLYPHGEFSFRAFYEALKARGFVLYPGKISRHDTFRIGSIGHVFPRDIGALVDVVKSIR